MESIRDDLEKLGLRAGDTVLVRSATRGMKAESGRPAQALFDSLLETLGPSGNLVTLSFTSDYYPWQKRAAKENAFKPNTKCVTGALAQIALDHPGSVRSKHPTNSYVAIGPDAEEIVRGHDESSTAFFPIDKLIGLGAKMILVGCTSSSPGFSTVHRAQEKLGLAEKTLLSGKRICAVATPEGIRWFARKDISGCSAGFGKFYDLYAAHGVLKTSEVGGVKSMLVDAASAYRIEMSVLEKDPTFAFCDDPMCLSCGSRTYAPKRMARFFLNIPRKIATRLSRRRCSGSSQVTF